MSSVLDEAIFRTYRHVYLLSKDNNLRHIDLGQITSSSAGSLVELIVHELERGDELTTSVSPAKLVKYWRPALVEWSTKAVRDAFYSSPQLPRLVNRRDWPACWCGRSTSCSRSASRRRSRAQRSISTASRFPLAPSPGENGPGDFNR